MNRALITGITGQDGSYLAELLPAKGYEVHDLARITVDADIAALACQGKAWIDVPLVEAWG